MSLYDDLNMILDEATYYGKNKGLVKIEGLFSSMRSELKFKNGRVHVVDNKKYQSYITSIENIISDMFGFRYVDINKSVLSRSIGALAGSHTYIQVNSIYDIDKLVSSRLTAEQYHENNISGVRFKKGSNIDASIYIDPSIIVDTSSEYDLTPAELTGVLLHEIGHNFYGDRGNLALNQLFTLMSPHGAISIASGSVIRSIDKVATKRARGNNKVNARQDKKASRLKRTSDVLTLSLRGLSLMDILTYDTFIGNYLADFYEKLTPFNLMLSMGKSLISMDQELYSDNFAASFGYAAELQTGIRKITDTDNNLLIKTALAGDGSKHIIDTFRLIEYILTLPIGVYKIIHATHPGKTTRLLNSINYMEEAILADDKNSRLNKEYKEKLEELKQILEEIDAESDEGRSLYEKLHNTIEKFEINNPLIIAYQKLISQIVNKKNLDF